ncbi:MAG TPA: tripartite tricarboxylate transporter substrate binding protein [Gammaproteobacteria bacterium]|nr:tripartite tricarboxylate transporter substrate binding protein [Gammaproteobacteria bacterium]
MRPSSLALVMALALSGCDTGGRGEPAIESIAIVIPYRAGGGFDQTVRLFAPFFERHLGGDIAVIPENAAGAGGRLGATKVYRARPDGSTLGIFNLPGFVLPEVLGERVDYDLRRLSWIGRVESEDYALLVAADSEFQTLDDLRHAREITFVSTGYGSTILAASQIVAEQLGMVAEPIFLTGYTGTAESLVGLMRGDGNVAIAPIASAERYVESGDLRALAVSGDPSALAGTPTFAELGYSELTPLNVQRSIAGPPDMDPAFLATLRAAFDAAVADPDFIAMAEGAGMTLDPTSGEAVVAEIEASFSYYERFRANLANPSASGRAASNGL